MTREAEAVESELNETLEALRAYKGNFGDDWEAFARAEVAGDDPIRAERQRQELFLLNRKLRLCTLRLFVVAGVGLFAFGIFFLLALNDVSLLWTWPLVLAAMASQHYCLRAARRRKHVL